MDQGVLVGRLLEIAAAGGAALLRQPVAAALLDVSEYTLAAWRRDGYGPPYVRLRRNDVRYDIRDVEAFIEAQKSTSIAEERAKGRTYNGAAESGGFR